MHLASILTSVPVLLPIAFAAVLVALLIVRPAITRSTEGKILALLALFVAPAYAAYAGLNEHVERSKSTSYCLSCHVMHDYGKSLRVDDVDYLAARHALNHMLPKGRECYSCHTNYGMYGDVHTKLRGMKHVAVTYFGTVADTIKIARRYRNRDCLACHAGAQSFEISEAHPSGSTLMGEIKAGTTSCIKSGCHHTVHDVHNLDGLAMWSPEDGAEDEGTKEIEAPPAPAPPSTVSADSVVAPVTSGEIQAPPTSAAGATAPVPSGPVPSVTSAPAPMGPTSPPHLGSTSSTHTRGTTTTKKTHTVTKKRRSR